MRLLQAMAGARHGGAETFFCRLAHGLQQAGVDQRVLIRPFADRLDSLAKAGVDAGSARFGGPFDLVTRARFRTEIDKFRPDIVLTWMNRATRFCPRTRVNKRFLHVGTPRGYYPLKYYRRCDYIVCATDDIAGFYTEQGWPEERIHVIPNFVAYTEMAPQPRQALDTPEDVRLLLALGRLHRNKGFDVLLKALADLPDHWLWLAGTGPLEARLKAMAGDLGVSERVRFLGWREDTPALFAAADIFVCPSRHEPFGNIVIEAWAHGVPVVAAASQGPKALIETGVGGMLVPADDPTALAESISTVSGDRDLAARLAAGGRAAYADGYTEAIGVDSYLDFFGRILG